MKIIDAISAINIQKPNGISDELKITWLSELDGVIRKEIIDRYEGAPNTPFTGYTVDTPGETELLAPYPYDNIYLAWLEERIDYADGDIARYNNSTALFNDKYTKFKNAYNREFVHKNTKLKLF